jgi:hypothetical protein
MIVISVFVGVTVKTFIECGLYSIPLLVKIPKSVTAFAIDTIVMLIGLLVAYKIKIVER